MRPLSHLLLLLAASLATAAAGAQTPLDSLIPSSPTPNGFIADGGPVFDAAALGRLNARIAEVQRATGGDVGVAILRDLHDRAPVDVGVAIYRAWKIGRVDSLGTARRDLGALLLVVPKELAPSGRGECFVNTGRGAEATLVDAEAGAICRDSVIPRLRTRDYEGAVAAGVGGIGAAFARAVDGAPALSPAPAVVGAGDRSAGERSRRPVLPAIIGVGVLAIWGMAGVVALRHHRRRKPRPCPRGHGPMTRLAEDLDNQALSRGQQFEERLGSVDYDVWACAQCDERLVIPYRRGSPYEKCPQCGHTTVAREVLTLREAEPGTDGIERITLECASCAWRDETRRVLVWTPPPPVSSGGSGFDSSSSGGSSFGGGGGGSSSFGGSGSTSGGGGGGSY